MKRTDPLLEVEGLTVVHAAGRGRSVPSVSGASFSIGWGEVLGLVGESGCGKTSIARALLQLPRPSAGTVVFEGVDWTRIPSRRLRPLRSGMQMVFQDPVSALNPRKRVGDIVAAPLAIAKTGSRRDRALRAAEALADVGLPEGCLHRRPAAFSGGECQRIQIARALISRPRLLVCDEAVSSLDVSVKAQILNLLEDLRRRRHLAMLFISHDLAVVKNVSDRVAVMYMGRFCEVAASEDLYRFPRHPYSRALLQAAVRTDTARHRTPLPLVPGEPPSAMDPPAGCRFHPRCPEARARCRASVPPLEAIRPGRSVACHFPLGDG